ncbi:branched-chain amino acid ABC transporter substrate-binding protein [Azospirillum soli]|uniref:branched-chain amino acid ABC transporter substrate-binding protein n=1 Tax=Azospirillum soli TaxID=1304799 RepID=UPI001AE9C687|nr:branched-chain amino acid ABC transporter substrate-binding protein [Azospirillum soli]MBP2313628.1 branched-chain amino acid transport system substrate-binding protein [Azospirillum soli]
MRSFLASFTSAAVLALLSSTAQAEPLRVAVIESLSGAQASTGRPYVFAARYVFDALNARGGFNGEKVVVTEYNSGGRPAGASEKFQQALAEGVHVVIQASSSAIASQLSDDIRQHNEKNPGKEVIYLNVGAEAMELTGEKCHFHAFRFTTTAPMRVGALVKVMKGDGSLGKRVYSINQNYSWGKDMEAATKANAPAGGYEVVEAVLHDVARIQDFTPFVAKIQAATPDTVITGNWSNDLLLLMKAAGDAGLKTRFGTAFLDQVGNISNAGDVALGHYIAHPYNIELSDGTFAKEYEAATGHFPVYVEPNAVNALKMFTKALETVNFGGGPVKATQIAQALEGTTYKTDIGDLSVRKEDHQVVMPVVVSRVEKGVKYPVDGTDLGFKPVKVVAADEVIYPVQASCAMQRP